MKTKSVLWVLLALLLLWPATTVLADEFTLDRDGGKIFVDEDVTLGPDEVWRGDLTVFRGNLDLPEGSTVHGDIFVADGDAHVAGRVNGSLAVVGGVLDLRATAQVQGDVFAMGGNQEVAGQVQGSLSSLFGNLRLQSSAVVDGDLLATPGRVEREDGALVRGNEVRDLPWSRIPFLGQEGRVEIEDLTPPVRPLPSVPQERSAAGGQRLGRYVGRFLSAAILSLALMAAGALIVIVWPRPTRRVAECLARMPLQSFGLGLLTFLLAAGLEALAAVLLIVIILVAALLIGTVILIPIGLLLILLSPLVLLPVPLALLGAMILGWVATAQWIGHRALKVLRVEGASSLGAVVAGLLLTVPVAAVLWIVKPLCCGWPFVILLTSLGLGAVFHTRFGRQSCEPIPPATGGTDVQTVRGDVLPIEAMDEEAGQPDAGTP